MQEKKQRKVEKKLNKIKLRKYHKIKIITLLSISSSVSVS